ncbi:MAG: hypothetical protein Q9218_007555, partial [Villophora microphyllina]
ENDLPAGLLVGFTAEEVADAIIATALKSFGDAARTRLRREVTNQHRPITGLVFRDLPERELTRRLRRLFLHQGGARSGNPERTMERIFRIQRWLVANR